MTDRFQAMRLFVRIGECGSFTAAAEDLQVSRSVASTIVQQLEARLGAQLLSRTTRHVELTSDGALYYEHCVRLLADLEESDSLFRETARVRGKLRVDMPSRVGRLVIVPVLPEFLARYPEVELELGTTDRLVDPLHEGIDCAIRVGESKESRLGQSRLGELALSNCASPSYLARHGIPKRVEDLAHHKAINYASAAGGRIYEWEYIERGEVKLFAMRSQLSVNSAETYIACALAGLGLIQVPSYDVYEQLKSGALVEVLANSRAKAMPITILYPRGRYVSRRVQAFADWASSVIANHILLTNQKLSTENTTCAP